MVRPLAGLTSVTMKNLGTRLAGPTIIASALLSAALWSTDRPASALTTVLRDPLSVFSDRSPGARAKGALFQTKERYFATPRTPVRERPPGVRERVLTLVRSRSPVEPFAPATPVEPQQPGYFPPPPLGSSTVQGVNGGPPRPNEPGLALGPGSIGGGGGGVSSDYSAPAPLASAT